MLYVNQKSKLKLHIEELIALQPGQQANDGDTAETIQEPMETPRILTVAIVDGMTELQSLKLKQANTCTDLANQFCKVILSK